MDGALGGGTVVYEVSYCTTWLGTVCYGTTIYYFCCAVTDRCTSNLWLTTVRRSKSILAVGVGVGAVVAVLLPRPVATVITFVLLVLTATFTLGNNIITSLSFCGAGKSMVGLPSVVVDRGGPRGGGRGKSG